MKRVKYKKAFKSLDEALTKVPNVLKENNNVFEMTDGNKTIKVRWEGNLTEGVAVPLAESDDKLINEDIAKMKSLMGYASEKTIGTPTATNRMNENANFKQLLGKVKKKALNESKFLGEVEAIVEVENINEGIKDIVVGLFMAFAALVNAQTPAPEKVEQVKQTYSQLNPTVKKVVDSTLDKKLSDEQKQELKAITGIDFGESADRLFTYEPAKEFVGQEAPELYLGKYGDIDAVKLAEKPKVKDNGRYEYTVMVNDFYATGDKLPIIRKYITSQNTNLENVTIHFVNSEGVPFPSQTIKL